MIALLLTISLLKELAARGIGGCDAESFIGPVLSEAHGLGPDGQAACIAVARKLILARHRKESTSANLS